MSELAAQTPTDRAQQLITLTERLTTLIEAETRHFEARKPHLAVAAQPEKTRLATIYRRESQMAVKDPARLAGLAAPLRARLRDATARFEAAVSRNGSAVEALKLLTEGLVRTIAEEAARQRQAESGYGPGARQPARIGAMAVNQSA